MKKPFQFSMRLMFGAVSFVCVAAWFVAESSRVYDDPIGFFLASTVFVGIIVAGFYAMVDVFLSGRH